MKSNKMSRAGYASADSGEGMKRAMKLEPNRKSGKDKHTLYRGLNQGDDDMDDEFDTYTKKESILDYFDDEFDDE